jgi:hypothetical protein
MNSQNIQEIRMDQTPDSGPWALIPLYKMVSEMLTWQIEFDGIETLQIKNNDTVIPIPIPSEPANYSVKERALFEARRQYKLMYRKGYAPAGETTATIIKPMHGYPYKEKSIKNWPVYVQLRLKGIKILSQDAGMGCVLMYGKISVSFLESELQEFFEYLPKYAILDGELYQPGISSKELIKKQDPTKVIYIISDIYYHDAEGTPYEKRYELLVNSYRNYVQDRNIQKLPIPQYLRIAPMSIAYNHEDIIQARKTNQTGLIIRKISNGQAPNTKAFNESLYKQGLGNHILHYK